MNPTDVCSTCGTPLPGGSLGKRCARCLLETGLANHLAQAQLEADAEEASSGQCFGDYKLLEEIARGGMGIVFKARQLSLNRIVAVKMLLSGHYATPESLQRFRVEAEAAASLHHSNIVAIHEFGDHEGQPYFSMDYVPGRSLADLTKAGPLPARSAARYAQLVAQAIHYAHQQGILHRDLKPSNILIDDDDQPRITDFGLAKRKAGDSALTLTGQTLGTPNYIPPEQVAGQHSRIGPWSDVYSLGAVLYHLLTGRAPFVAETITTTLRMVQEAEPVALRLLNPGIPRDLETVCLKCLEKEPGRRYGSAADLADELGRFLAGEPILARPIGPAGKVWRWSRRNPRMAGVVGVSALAVLVISGLAAWQIALARQQERLETYASSIALADKYINDGSIDRALDLLTNCPAEFRHWEWGQLLYLCHQDIVSIPVRTNFTSLTYQGSDVPIRDLAFDATGSRLGVLNVDGQVKVFSPNDGRQLFASTNTENRVMSWTFHPAGSELALGMTNGTIVIFDTTTWHQQQILWLERVLTNRLALSNTASALQGEIKGQRSMVSITSLAYDSSGHRLAAATSDGRIKVRHLASGQERLIPADEPVAIEKIWFTPDGQQLVVQRRLAVRRLDADTGRELSIFRKQPDQYWAVFADLTGQHLATIDIKDQVQLWSNGIPTHALGVMTLARSDERHLFFSQDGQFLCMVGDRGTAGLYEVATGKRVFPIPEYVRRVAFNIQGTRLVAAGGERLVKVWDIAQGEELLPLRGNLSLVDQATFSPDGRLIAMASLDGFVRIWSSSPGRKRYPFGTWPWGAAYSPNGNRLTATGYWDNLKVWDADSGRLELVLKSLTHFPLAAAFSPDGRYIVSGGSEKTARIWDARSGDLVRVLRGHARSILSVAYSRDGQRIATGDLGGDVIVWEAQTGRPLRTLSDQCGYVWSVEFDPSGRQLVTADYSGPPRIWDVASGRLQFKLEKCSAGTLCVRFRPNKPQVAALCKDRWLRIWDARTGRLIDKWQSRSLPTEGMGYSPDGQRLAVPVSDNYYPGGEKGMIEIWDVEHKRQLLELKNHSDVLLTARFSPDGRRLLSTSLDFTARQEESFPWQESEYPKLPGATFRDRVRTYAREYWRTRLAKEGAVPLNPTPRSSSKDPDQDLFPPRDPGAGMNLINLSAHYTGLLDAALCPTADCFMLDDDLTALRTNLVTGLTNFGGVPFDVRGVVMLWRLNPRGGAFQRLWEHYPKSVQGIQIGRRVHHLQVLHGVCGWPIVKDGTPIGGFVWHYSDGSQRETEIVYGRDLRNWWFGDRWDGTIWENDWDPQVECERGRIVWKDDNPVAKQAGARLRLYLTAYDNPRSDLEVTSIDFVSKMTTAAPFLVALTVEP